MSVYIIGSMVRAVMKALSFQQCGLSLVWSSHWFLLEDLHYFSVNERFGMKGGIHGKAKHKICDENNGCCYTKKVCLQAHL